MINVTKSRSYQIYYVDLTDKISKLVTGERMLVRHYFHFVEWKFFRSTAALFLIMSLCGLAKGHELSIVSNGLASA